MAINLGFHYTKILQALFSLIESFNFEPVS